jgi:D-amino-acid oxidase
MPQSAHDVAVIGGGVSGLTTAVLLQANDYRTTLYTQARPGPEPDVARDPEFATLHAAASILPHSVDSPRVEYWTKLSQRFFQALSFQAACGVRSQTHYEVFESRVVDPPVYALSVDNFEPLSERALKVPWVPRRSGASPLSGWKFDVFFCEAPEYVRYLVSLYRQIGGEIVEPPDLPGDSLRAYLALNYDFYINCTGQHAAGFLEDTLLDPHDNLEVHDAPGKLEGQSVVFEPLLDPFPPKLIRGHYLRVDIKRILTGERKRFFSYNYKPIPDVYRTQSGAPADVYCYPRSDAWILGGSRQEGTCVDGEWKWEETIGKEIAFPCDQPGGTDLLVPAPIFDLNADLLIQITEDPPLDLRELRRTDPSLILAGVGYRFVRDAPDDSVRVTASRLSVGVRNGGTQRFNYVLHNYGHGGSGFTLSWGCAFNLLQILDRITGMAREGSVTPGRRKFVTEHSATRMILLDLTARLLENPPVEYD